MPLYCECGQPGCRGDHRTPREQFVALIIRNVCELPDYTSPDDQPDLLTCTVGELDACIERAIDATPGIAAILGPEDLTPDPVDLPPVV